MHAAHPTAARRATALGLLVLCVAATSCSLRLGGRPERPAPRAGRVVLERFDRRLGQARRRVPELVRAAEAAAARIVAHPNALLSLPYAPQRGFAEEFINRSGGIAHALPPEDRPSAVTSNDIALLSVRAWEADGPDILPRLAQARSNGWMTILFASRKGMPPEARPDFLIDNGASSGGREEASLNAIANVLNGWLWTCEYAAALTRQGKHPGILLSGMLPESGGHNRSLQTPRGRFTLGSCTSAVPAGRLAAAYLARVERLSDDLASDPVQGQIETAADLIARHLLAGGRVGAATCTHVGMAEIFADHRTPWTPFHVVWRASRAFADNLAPGDLLFWLGYMGIRTPNEDYAGAIRATGVRFVSCFAPDPDPRKNAPDAAAHIDQSWALGDAEVPIPFPPGRMGPVSGLNAILLYRMLDEEVARRLETGVDTPESAAPRGP